MVKPIIEELGYFPDPVSTYSVLKEEPYSSFLDSGMNEEKLGRFSFIGYNPFMVAQCRQEDITLFTPLDRRSLPSRYRRHLTGRAEGGTEKIKDNPFRFLKEALSYYKTERVRDDIPFASGCIGYFSYDLRYFIERLPSIALDDINMPDFILCFYDVIIIFDSLMKKAYISSSGFPFIAETKNRKRARVRLEETKNKLRGIVSSDRNISSDVECYTPEFDNFIPGNGISSNFTKEEYCRTIERAKELIARGDIYQVNLSQRLKSNFDSDPFELYLRLRSINPAPFAAYLNFDGFKIVSASPERFLKICGRDIETRPIKGTRPRGSNDIEDLLLKRQLLSSAKDSAEHIMIVDLERNDLGRISEYGSVKPTEFIILETYSTVHHLVSTVSGKLRNGVDIVDCLKNCFPGGSITGAPKVRSMEVIEELEPTRRGIYTGSIGYIDFCGNADLSIVIRTIVIKDKSAYFQVGGGIVADSDPEKEYQETLDKARALVEAVNIQKACGLKLSSSV
jgi:para-aminobenzoate synthetase component 1